MKENYRLAVDLTSCYLDCQAASPEHQEVQGENANLISRLHKLMGDATVAISVF